MSDAATAEQNVQLSSKKRWRIGRRLDRVKPMGKVLDQTNAAKRLLRNSPHETLVNVYQGPQGEVMEIVVETQALIPRRVIADAARESSSRAFGRLRKLLKDIRVTVTDRRARPHATCCQVEIDVHDGPSIVARSNSADPVVAVSQAFETAARYSAPKLRKQRMWHTVSSCRTSRPAR